MMSHNAVLENIRVWRGNINANNVLLVISLPRAHPLHALHASLENIRKLQEKLDVYCVQLGRCSQIMPRVVANSVPRARTSNIRDRRPACNVQRGLPSDQMRYWVKFPCKVHAPRASQGSLPVLNLKKRMTTSNMSAGSVQMVRVYHSLLCTESSRL